MISRRYLLSNWWHLVPVYFFSITLYKYRTIDKTMMFLFGFLEGGNDIGNVIHKLFFLIPEFPVGFVRNSVLRQQTLTQNEFHALRTFSTVRWFFGVFLAYYHLFKGLIPYRKSR